MRRYVLAISVALVAVLALPSAAAAAAFDHHFKVVSEQIAGEGNDNTFRFTDALLNPFNLSQRVGRDRGKCTFNRETRKARCKVVAHLDGTIGGYGNLLVKGNIGRDDNTLLVVNGTGDFNGVTGKVTLHHYPGRRFDKLHIDLVR